MRPVSQGGSVVSEKSRHIMRRFPDQVGVFQGAASPDAKRYGAGAFSFERTGEGLFLICRHPEEDAQTTRLFNVPLEGEKAWSWNRSKDRPTLSPSVRVYFVLPDGTQQDVWHGFITDGVLITLE